MYRISIEKAENEREMNLEDSLDIARWDERFNQVKQGLAEKDEIFRELYNVTNGRQYSRRMRAAFKLLEKASRKVNGTKKPLKEIVRLFIYDASLRLLKYWSRRRHCTYVDQAKQCTEDHAVKKKHLPDLLDENFFKDVLYAIRTWQI